MALQPFAVPHPATRARQVQGLRRPRPQVVEELAAIRADDVTSGLIGLEQRHDDRAVQLLVPALAQDSVFVVRAFVRLRELMNPPAPKRRGIGFTADISDPK